MMQVEEEEEYHPPAVHLIQQPTVRAQSSNETAQKRKGTKRSAITVTQPEIETVAQMPINPAPTISGRPVQKVTLFPTFPNIIASDISLQPNATMEVINEVLNDESTAMREVSPVTIHEIQKSQSQTAELLVKAESSRKTAEKLRGILLSTAASEKKLKRENDEISTQLEAMGRCAKEMEESFEKIGKFVEKELSTSSEASPPTKAFVEPKPPKPLEECSESYKRAKVLETVRSLENEPLLKQGVLKRLATEKKEEDTKFTPLEAVAMSVSVGMNESKLEKLKSFLRLKNMDFLPTVRKMRNEIKNIYNDNKYETLEDKEKGIYCRRAVEVEKFVESRISGALKSNNYEDAPGFEDCSFMAVNLDKGGGQIKFTISACNVKKGKASPNASAIIGVAKAKEDDYETYKFCFKKNFDQINALDGKIMEFNINGQIIRKRIIFLVCCDGKMMSILAGHAGAAATNPCFTCEATKSEINQGIFATLRTAERTKQQAEDFLKNGSLPQSKSIKNPPLLTIPMDRWIYGSLHCVSGPASAVLKKVEEEALDEDLKNLGITILSNKEERKKAAALQDTIEAIKSEIDDLEKAFKLSKVVLKARKTQQNRHVEPFTGQCQAEYCLKEILGNKSLFNT
uniref:Uncharacterized protein n=1 Tax=Panagrolaimus davidi TaxID=227884 RepID=A0A914Q954_9BILA